MVGRPVVVAIVLGLVAWTLPVAAARSYLGWP
jgi:hypothetical protein